MTIADGSLDDLSLTRHLAEKIMGWEVWKDGTPEGKFIAHGETIHYYEMGSWVSWVPFHDMNDAMGIVQKLRADDWHYELGDSHHSDEHCAKFGRGKYDRYDDTWEIEHFASASTPHRAICLAALETREEGKS